MDICFPPRLLIKDVQKIALMEDKMIKSPLHKDPRLPELFEMYAEREVAKDRIRALKKRIQATKDVLQMEELKCRKRVLRRLGFTDASDIVDMKGRVACEISSGDELLLTELIFNGAFNTLEPEQCAALLSCFVFADKVCVALGFLSLADSVAERANDQAKGGAGGAIAVDAGVGEADRQGVERVEDRD